MKSEIEEKVKELGLEDNVIFYGTTQEIPKLLWIMDVFLFPSKFEGLGIVLIETQAAALKTFASSTITEDVKISDYVEFLSIEGTPEEWAKEVLKLNKSYQRENMYDVVIEKGYDITDVAKQIQELYCKGR